ncbi:MAG: RES family NAD+ phosphorylase, partial [Gammaproteobacteria bacterium]|nr:RES family NAD+ phosphorylase [Gammaproteobacteria bacterium]
MSIELKRDVEFASWQSYWRFSKTVRRERRYVWPSVVQEFLEAVRQTAKKRELLIPKDMPFYRAQLGWKHDVEERDDGKLDGPRAYGPKRMKPTANHALDYRANTAGIPVLYLAMEIETAIAEVRPWIGSAVSVSQFRTKRELRGLDLTPEFGKHWMPTFSANDSRFMPVDADGAEKAAWTNIDNAFSKPVSRSDDPADYVPTQILAELFRAEGYEAIIYRSQLGEQGQSCPIRNEPEEGADFQRK